MLRYKRRDEERGITLNLMPSYALLIVSQFKEDYFHLRTMDAHRQHCMMVENDATGCFSIEYGVNSRSCLLELNTFDICSGALLPDVMHDILEGTLQHVLQLLLTYCIDDFTLKELNDNIEGMELGYMEDARPTIVDNHKHLRQNGILLSVHIII